MIKKTSSNHPCGKDSESNMVRFLSLSVVLKINKHFSKRCVSKVSQFI